MFTLFEQNLKKEELLIKKESRSLRRRGTTCSPSLDAAGARPLAGGEGERGLR